MNFATLIFALTTLTSIFAQATPTFTNGDQLTAQFRPGTLIIQHSKRRLLLVYENNQVLIYPVAVPKNGKTWSGETRISGKYVRPDWRAPEEVARDVPSLRGRTIPGGSPDNPMGERAMTLENNSVTQDIAIHGVTKKMDASIGTAASYGCIRMHNVDVVDLYDRVSVGTPVVMVP